MRVARERRQGLPRHGCVNVNGEDVAGSRLTVDGPKLSVGVAHRRDRSLHVFIGGRSGLDRHAVRKVVAERDVGTHNDGRGVAERLALFELRQLRIRPIDRLDALHLDDLSVRLVHKVVRGVLPEMLLAVCPLVHSPRCLARTKAGYLRALHVPLERRVRRAREAVRRDLNIERDLRSRLSANRVLHG